MADTTKTKVLNINTTQSEKNVKSLKTQLRELREQLATLEKGTVEYDRVAQQLADTTQKQIEIQEAAKYSNRDVGQTLSNIASVSAGVVGGINAINSVMVMMGADSEEAQKALQTIQLTMAAVQGLGAIDTATKALKGLLTAYKDFNSETASISRTQETASTIADTAATEANTAAKEKNAAAETANATATEANTAAKAKNATATAQAAAAEKAMNTTSAKSVPLLKRVANGFVGVAKAIKSFIAANPWLSAIMATLAAIGAAVAVVNRKLKEATEEARNTLASINEINSTYAQEHLNMDVLVRMYQNQNTTLEQKKALAKEINKLAGDEIVTEDAKTKQLTIQGEKLRDYNMRLRSSVELDYHKKAILDIISQKEQLQAEALEKNNQNSRKHLEEMTKLTEQQEKHWREIEKLTSGMVDNLNAANKPNTTKSGGSGIVRAFKDIADEIRELFNKVVSDIYDARQLRLKYNGIYTESVFLLDRIEKLIQSRGLSEKITDELNKAIEDEKNQKAAIRNYNVTLDFIFDKDTFSKLEKQLVDAREKLSEMLNKKSNGNNAALDRELTAQKAIVTELERQLADMTELANAVQTYADAMDRINAEQRELTQSISRYNAETKIQNEATLAARGGDANADANERVRLAELELELAKKQYEEDLRHRKELESLVEAKKNNQKIYEDLVAYNEKVFESDKAVYEAQAELDNALYERRQRELEQLWAKIDKETADAVKEMEVIPNLFGTMHFDDYNSPVIQVETQLEGLQRMREQTEAYFASQYELYKGNSQMILSLQQEENAAMLEIQKQQNEKEIELDKAKVDRRIEIQRTYVNLYQSLTSQISGLLSAQMQNYDENSSKYKKLQYAQGVVDVSSGVLAAFMSGIKSGVPAPWNLAVAAAMAGITLATGIANLKAIKNGTLANTPSAQTVDFGTYDTLTYQQNADIISSIRDQKVYVTEQDISSTQNRVRVAEANAVY